MKYLHLIKEKESDKWKIPGVEYITFDYRNHLYHVAIIEKNDYIYCALNGMESTVVPVDQTLFDFVGICNQRSKIFWGDLNVDEPITEEYVIKNPKICVLLINKFSFKTLENKEYQKITNMVKK